LPPGIKKKGISNPGRRARVPLLFPNSLLCLPPTGLLRNRILGGRARGLIN